MDGLGRPGGDKNRSGHPSRETLGYYALQGSPPGMVVHRWPPPALFVSSTDEYRLSLTVGPRSIREDRYLIYNEAGGEIDETKINISVT